jgi:hypothetical protein
MSDGVQRRNPPPYHFVVGGGEGQVVSSGRDGKIFFDKSPGDLVFNATGLPSVLDEAARKATN